MITILTSFGDYLRDGLNAYVKTVSPKFDDWDVRYYISEDLARNAKTKLEKKARKAGSPWLIFEAEIESTESLQGNEKQDGVLQLPMFQYDLNQIPAADRAGYGEGIYRSYTDNMVSVYDERYSIPIDMTLVCLVGEINAAKPEMRWLLLKEIRNLCRVGNTFDGYNFETATISGKQDLTGRMIDFEEPNEHQFDVPINIQGRVNVGRVNRGEQKFHKLSGTVKHQLKYQE